MSAFSWSIHFNFPKAQIFLGLIIALACLYPNSSLAKPSYELVLDSGNQSSQSGHFEFQAGLEYLVDPSQQLQLADLLTNDHADHSWSLTKRKHQNFGNTSDAYWFRFDVINRNVENDRYILFLPDAGIDHIDLFVMDSNNKLLKEFSTGDKLPYSSRPIDFHFFAFPLTFELDKGYQVYLRIQRNTSKVAVVFSLWEELAFFLGAESEDHSEYFFLGMVLIMAAFNFAIFLFVRDTAYFWYVLFVSSIFMTNSSMFGYGFQSVWPEAIWWQGKATLFFIILAEISSLLFLSYFLHLEEESPLVNRINAIAVGIMMSFLTIHLAVESNLIFVSHMYFTIFLITWMLYVSGKRWREGSVHARNYFIAWSPLLICMIIRYLVEMGVMPFFQGVSNMIEIGITLQILLFSMALAYRINTLQESRRRAEADNKAKSDFLANMSHEIRTPMNGVVGMTDVMLKTTLDAQQKHYLKQIRKSAHYLLQIINDILDFSKIESGKLPLESLKFDLVENIAQAMRFFSDEVAEKGLDFYFKVGEIPSQSVVGDPTRLRQIVINLVSNAIKFTSEGSVRVQLDVVQGKSTGEKKAKTATENYRIVVSDTGIGIDQDKIETIFEHFSQADNSITRRYGGSGLGLSICKQLLNLMGGELKVSSEKNKGTHFTVEIPLQPTMPVCQTVPVDSFSVQGEVVWLGDTNSSYVSNPNGMLNSFSPRCFDSPADLIAKVDSFAPQTTILISLSKRTLDDSLIETLGVLLQLNHCVFLIGSTNQLIEIQDAGLDFDAGNFLIEPVIAGDFLAALNQSELSLEDAGGGSAEEQASNPLAGMKVLIVDDNDINLEVAKLNLVDYGLQVVEARNGFEAFSCYRKERLALIFMDLHMPKMNGYDATKAIKQLQAAGGPKVPVVALTANALEGEREKCLALGFDDFLTKPFEETDLENVITKFLLNTDVESEKSQELVEQDIDADTQVDESVSITSEEPASIIEADFSSICDLEALAKRVNHKMERIDKLLNYFTQSFPNYYSELMKSIESKDFEAIQMSAHSIKGVSGNLELLKLYRSSVDIEALAKTKEGLDSIERLAKQMQPQFEEFQQFLEQRQA